MARPSEAWFRYGAWCIYVDTETGLWAAEREADAKAKAQRLEDASDNGLPWLMSQIRDFENAASGQIPDLAVHGQTQIKWIKSDLWKIVAVKGKPDGSTYSKGGLLTMLSLINPDAWARAAMTPKKAAESEGPVPSSQLLGCGCQVDRIGDADPLVTDVRVCARHAQLPGVQEQMRRLAEEVGKAVVG